MPDVAIGLGTVSNRIGTDARFNLYAPEVEGQPYFYDNLTTFEIGDYVVVDGVPQADSAGAKIISEAGVDSYTQLVVPPDPETLFPDTGMHWVPGTEHATLDGQFYRWWPVGGTRNSESARMSFFNTIATGGGAGLYGMAGGVPPYHDNDYTYQGLGRNLTAKAVVLPGSAHIKLDPEANFTHGTMMVCIVPHPSNAAYYGIFEAATLVDVNSETATGDALVLRWHHGELRLYHENKLVLTHESRRRSAAPIILAFSFDTSTDVGRFFALDENRTTRSFNTEGMDYMALLGVVGALGQGVAANRYRYPAEMDILSWTLWDRAMDWPELENKVNLLSLAFGVGVWRAVHDVVQTTQEDHAYWRVVARKPGMEPVDVTYVRGVPTTIGDWKEQSPFGWQSFSLTFPGVTMYDRIGQGDLAWLGPEVDFDVEWVAAVPDGYPYERFVLEGYSMPVTYEDNGVTLDIVGATFEMDNWLAKPEFANQPFPYEVAIRRQWDGKPSRRLRNLKIQWPHWWENTYTPVPKALPQYIPTGVRKGDRWTGLLTRETGSWDPCLTGYIQALLTSMYTERGRWTIELRPGRRPVMKHLDIPIEPTEATVVVSPLQPGVKISLKEDWSQSANVFYGQVKSLSGEGYSGMQVIGDGQATVYKPLAALRQVEPTDDRNTWLQQSRMRKESLLQVQDGLTTREAIKLGQNHLQHFADPGLQGTVTLTSDVHLLNGSLEPQPMSRALIRAGMTLHLPGYKGIPEGVLLSVVDTSYSPDSGTMTLTADTKWRDKLTMDEVKIRGRDALSVPRMLIAGKYAPPLPDMLFPWNYAEGSGYIPSSPTYNARRLFEDMPGDIAFPWTEWTTQRPPSSASWKSSYIKIAAKHANADNNWAFAANRSGGRFGFPIRMAQAGQVRLLQIAAYDRDGNVMAVPFHFSLYYQRDVNVKAMPRIPVGKVPPGSGYLAGQHYPFFEQAFETYNTDGTQVGTEVPVTVQSAGLIQGWGTATMKAGHWPGSSAGADEPTGLLVDETPFDFNLVGPTPHINQYAKGDVSPYAGYLYCMIYCDAQEDEDVYFMGRLYRSEPGSSV